MNVEEAKKNTMQALGITDFDEVSYITQELLDEYQSKSISINKKSSISPKESSEAGDVHPMLGYSSYGNSLVFQSEVVYFKANDKGTPDYGCGTKNWEWRLDRGDTFTPQPDCSGGRKKYILHCPTCI